MQHFIKTLTSNWHLMRVLRLLIGMALLVQAFYFKDSITGLFGGLFLFQAIADIGCMGGSCNV